MQDVVLVRREDARIVALQVNQSQLVAVSRNLVSTARPAKRLDYAKNTSALEIVASNISRNAWFIIVRQVAVQMCERQATCATL